MFIVTVNPLAGAMSVLQIMAWVGCLVATVAAFRRKIPSGWLSLLAFLAAPILFLFAIEYQESEYRVFSKIVDRDGSEFHLVIPGDDGSNGYIAKMVEKTWSKRPIRYW